MIRKNGFTLIELLTTMSIAAILVTMAVPGLKSFTLNSRQTAGINELVSGMHLARNTAITMNTIRPAIKEIKSTEYPKQ